ncbi:MAG: transporter, partial [Bacteroidales bacterium]|nr:transporter [Bacteroidales bacterium]
AMGNEKPTGNRERPKTLLTWAGGQEKVMESPPKSPTTRPEAEEPLATDRPDFTEASSTVGRGRVQLESGYTFVRDRLGGVTMTSHSYPEVLLRAGLLADWFEFRIGQNFGNVRANTSNGVFSPGGAEDLYLGTKLALAEQHGLFPETALIIQSQIPTGHRDFTSGRVLPGLNLLCGWDVIEDRLSVGGSFQANRVIDENKQGYVECAQSFTIGYGLTEKLGAYTEWFAFYPVGATAPGVVPQHYFNSGVVYRVTPNFQLDFRAGVGLNRAADDFFTGTGFAIRY